MSRLSPFPRPGLAVGALYDLILGASLLLVPDLTSRLLGVPPPGEDVEEAAHPGQAPAPEPEEALEAAEEAGVYVPRLCFMKGLTPAGSCRVCTVRVNGRPQAACTTPAVKIRLRSVALASAGASLTASRPVARACRQSWPRGSR